MYFTRMVLASVFCACVSLVLLNRGESPREKFKDVSGRITYIGDSAPDGYGAANPKHRYLVLDDHPEIYHLFIGHDFGDLAPAFEQMDSLRVKDEVHLFVDDRPAIGQAPRHNELTYFIDRDGRNFYRQGRSMVPLAWVLLGSSVALLIAGMVLKKNGRIT